jgi:hypothetical protein
MSVTYTFLSFVYGLLQKERPVITLEDIYKKFSGLTKFPVKKIDKSEIEFFVQQFKLTSTHAIFLFHMRNEAIADQVQFNRKTNKARSFPKVDGDVPAYSAHFVISRKPIIDGGDTYTAYFENVEGIGKTSVISYFVDIFQQMFTTTFVPEPKKTPKVKRLLKHLNPENVGHIQNCMAINLILCKVL